MSNRHAAARPTLTSIRLANQADATAINKLVTANVGLGQLLPRSAEDIQRNVARFVVATKGSLIVGCGELAPLSDTLSEIRSLVVSIEARGCGIGSEILGSLVTMGRQKNLPRLCAFTHVPHPFVSLGFSIVPHTWLPEKIMTDCQRCDWFRRCEQYAVVNELSWGQSGPRGTARTI
ncbi:MAG: hypothetical protein CL484_00825 [Acidobacteria bacterium]|nr:hypothetical protein [Acidobacteriota bacterium]